MPPALGHSRRRAGFLTEGFDRGRLPVVLLSGFLGSGKTTLVNALLADPRLAGTAVAVNEFGTVALDQHLIDHGQDRTVVMANGCLCCNVAGDLEDAVMRVFSRRGAGAVPRFLRLIVEPSGLADPAPIAQAILRNPVMSRVLRLDAIVTAVDAVFACAQLARHPETRKQVALADQLVLTKSDLVTPEMAERVRAALRGHNPAAPIHTALHGAVDAAALLPAGFIDVDAVGLGRPGWFAGLWSDAPDGVEAGGHLAETVATSIEADAPLRWEAFDTWLRGVRLSHGEQLLRVKGLLHIAGAAGPVVVHGVHHVLHAPVELDGWPGPVRQSRLVLITQGLEPGALRRSWDTAFPREAAGR